MRKFDSGATRDENQDKPNYEGFLSPLVLEEFGRYMHKHRYQADGEVRDGDNWQKGIPTDAYMDSLIRHMMDVWLHHRGYPERAREDLKEALCAVLFNVQGILLNTILESMQPQNCPGEEAPVNFTLPNDVHFKDTDNRIVHGAVCPDCGGNHETGHQRLCGRLIPVPYELSDE